MVGRVSSKPVTAARLACRNITRVNATVDKEIIYELCEISRRLTINTFGELRAFRCMSQ